MTLGEKLRQKRTLIGYDMRAASRFVGVNYSTYTRWERDLVQPRFEHRLKLAELFGVPVTALQDDKAA